MDFQNTRQAAPGRTRTLLPLGDADPDFFVELEEISDAEQAAIFDKFDYLPGGRKATVAKLNKVTRATVKRRIRNFGGLTEKGVPVECTDEAKLRFLTTEVEFDGEVKTLWLLTIEAEDRQKDEERKN